jgi:cytidyltransferase-like protein
MIIPQESLGSLREDQNLMGKKIAFCSGTFDLAHAGHVLFLEDCKKLADIVVVGVGSDALIHSYKGSTRPIMNEHIRLKMIDSLKPVDYAFLQIVSDPKNMLEEFLPYVFQNLQPDMYVINEDAFDIPSRERLSKEYGVSLIIFPRTCPPEFEGISTTSLIKKIQGDS